MGFLSFISSIFDPVSKTIDNLHTSDEEKMELRNKLAEIQGNVQTKLIDLEGKLADADSKIRVAEAQSPHLITAIWRPISCLALVTILILASFGIGNPDDSLYTLAQIVIGGYVGGRSLEKLGTTLKLGK